MHSAAPLTSKVLPGALFRVAGRPSFLAWLQMTLMDLRSLSNSRVASLVCLPTPKEGCCSNAFESGFTLPLEAQRASQSKGGQPLPPRPWNLIQCPGMGKTLSVG